MSSNIQTTTIDESYPVAGRDNDTQGFRDNFGVIKNNFAAAKAEIEDLQDNAARKDADNNFLGSKLIDADLQASTEVMYNGGSVGTTELGPLGVVSFLNGHYHKYNLNSDSAAEFILNLVDWPSASENNRYAKIVVELFSTSGDKTVEWTSNTTTGSLSEIKKSTNWPTTFSVPNSESVTIYTPVIAEFWSYDGGVTVYANYLGSFQ